MFFIIIITVGISAFFIDIYKKYKLVHIIKDIPTSKIRSVAMGFSEVVGTVKSKHYLKTPISKKDCVYYSYVKEKYYSNKNSSSWRVVEKSADSLDFFITDDFSDIKVEVNDAKFYVKAKNAQYFSAKTNLNVIGKSFKYIFTIDSNKKELLKNELAEHEKQNIKDLEIINGNPKFPLRTFPGDVRIVERFIEPNDVVYVLGTVTSEDVSDKHIITKGKNTTFFISNFDEKSIIKRFIKKMRFSVIGLIIFIGLNLLFFYLNGGL